MRDPEAMSKLTKEQVSYINEQILTDGGFVNNKELFGDKVWVPNADGGYMPVDPSLVTTTYGGKPVVDPRIFVNHTGGIEYPADYNLPTNTGGNQILNNDKGSHILVGGESQVGDWKDNALFARDRTVDKAAEKLGYGHRIPPQKAPFNSMDKMFIGMAKIILPQMLTVIMFPMVGKFLTEEEIDLVLMTKI